MFEKYYMYVFNIFIFKNIMKFEMKHELHIQYQPLDNSEKKFHLLRSRKLFDKTK